MEEKVPDDYGPQRWLVFDEEEWGRLLASPDPATFEVYLHLTREQEELLASAPPCSSRVPREAARPPCPSITSFAARATADAGCSSRTTPC